MILIVSCISVSVYLFYFHLFLVCLWEEYYFPAMLTAFPLHLFAVLLMLCTASPRLISEIKTFSFVMKKVDYGKKNSI